MTDNRAPGANQIDNKSGRSPLELSPERLREVYYFLQLNRQLETRLERLFRQGKIFGGLYSSLGQEAVSVGAACALEPHDWLAPMIRNIGALLVKGVPPRDIFTQHMGRETSPTRGKDATSHFADLKDRHIVAPTSMLGHLIPVMTGVAMGGRYLGQQIVALTWIGDGGSSSGAFHEGMNLAASQRAPLVVVLENNQWAYSTPVSRQVPLRDFAQRAAAYGIRSAIVDGNDVLAVYRATKNAVAECRAGRGPWLIEAKTMRMKGHAQHDAADYVPKEMFEYWKARDPITQLERYLGERGVLTREQKAEINARIDKELDAEQKIAGESPFPATESAAQGVYCEGCHTIDPNWRRPIGQVTPPATATQAVWQIADYGAAVQLPGQAKGQSPAQSPSQPPRAAAGVGHKHRPPDNKHAHAGAHHKNHKSQQPPLNRAGMRPEEPAEESLEESDAAKLPSETPQGEIPVRIPFGRGPKDRAFVKEQPPPAAPRRGPQPHQPHRHDQRQDHRPDHRKPHPKGKR